MSSKENIDRFNVDESDPKPVNRPELLQSSAQLISSLAHEQTTTFDTGIDTFDIENPDSLKNTRRAGNVINLILDEKGTIQTGTMLTIGSLVNVFLTSKNNPISNCVNHLCAGLPYTLTSLESNDLNEKVSKLYKNFDKKFRACNKRKQRLLETQTEWLNQEFVMPQHTQLIKPKIIAAETQTPKRKFSDASEKHCRPTVKRKLVLDTPEFKSKSKRTQDRHSEDAAKEQQGFATALLLSAASRNAKAKGKADMAMLLKLLSEDDALATRLLKSLEPKPEVLPYTDEEALALLINQRLSTSQYNGIRSSAITQNCNMYPSFKKVARVKLMCRPVGKPSFNKIETSVSVPLASLLRHTSMRIVRLQSDVLNSHQIEDPIIRAELICSWGFDGSGTQAQYEFKSAIKQTNMFATTVIPLRLHCLKTRQILWQNPTPQSVRFCRPLKLQYVKEDESIVMNEKKRVDAEISCLKFDSFDIESNRCIQISCKMCLTVIDGKVLCIITDTKSSQCCPMCRATPTMFNKLTNFGTDVFKIKGDPIQHGISPLHARIRILENCLHIAYKLAYMAHKWRMDNSNAVMVTSIKNRKQEIHDILIDKLGIRVDEVKPKEVLGLDVDLMRQFHLLLTAINCHLPLNSEKFGKFCDVVAKKYVALYPWYPMSATLHKILIHGAEISAGNILPLGMLAEEGGESRNKYYRNDREHHARKSSLENNMTDIFNFAMETSDPYISATSIEIRGLRKHRLPFPKEVIELLAEPTLPAPGETVVVEDADFVQEDFFVEDDDIELESEEIL